MSKIDSNINDRYEVIKTLGEGAMGLVLLCKDTTDEDKPIVIKFIHPEDVSVAAHESWQTIEKRLINELNICKKIDSPNVIKAYDLIKYTGPLNGEHVEDLLGYTMEYVEGPDLIEAVSTSDTPANIQLSTDDIISISLQVLDGLATLHDNGVIHRDMKLENVLIQKKQSGWDAKIADLGLAKDLAIRVGLSRKDNIYGTHAYMCPEALDFEKAAPARDLYAFGVILLELLTKAPRSPDSYFRDVTLLELKHLPSEFHYIVAKCLEKNPSDRYQDARDAIKDLQSPSPIPYSPRRRTLERPVKVQDTNKPSLAWHGLAIGLSIGLLGAIGSAIWLF